MVNFQKKIAFYEKIYGSKSYGPTTYWSWTSQSVDKRGVYVSTTGTTGVTNTSGATGTLGFRNENGFGGCHT